MADLGFGPGGFDPNAPENQSPSNAIPKGKYLLAIASTELKPTKANDGRYLRVEFQVVRGEYQNRRIWWNCNLFLHPSKQKAIQIARGQFSQLCRAVGIPNIKDSTELHGKTVVATVKVTEDRGYGEENDITKFESANGSIGAAAPEQQPAQPQYQHSDNPLM